VVPFIDEENEDVKELQINQVKNELKRVVNFSGLAENKMHTFSILDGVSKKYGINLYQIENDL